MLPVLKTSRSAFLHFFVVLHVRLVHMCCLLGIGFFLATISRFASHRSTVHLYLVGGEERVVTKILRVYLSKARSCGLMLD